MTSTRIIDRQGRPLTDGERALAGSVFGSALSLDRVRLHRRRWWPLQPRGVVMAPDGHIWFHPQGPLWRADFAVESLILRGLLVHELTHVWQTQRGINLSLRRHPFCRYRYRITPGWRLDRYGLEQQAEIVRHAYLIREGVSVAGAPPLAQYLTILPFDFAPRSVGQLLA